MKRFRILIAAAFGLLLTGVAAQAAVDAFTTGNLNMRVGPGAGYARIITIPAHAGVTIFGCSGRWCDVGWSRYRGWVSARYLDQGRRRHYAPPEYEPYYVPPFIGFSFGNVWGPRHYHRPHYEYRRVDRPRPRFQRPWNNAPRHQHHRSHHRR